jgi:ureidoglycolate lyase
MNVVIKAEKISIESFSIFGDVISKDKVRPFVINEGFAKRFDDLATVDTAKSNGSTKISIFNAKPRTFPLDINMMEKHPLGSQAFIPITQTSFLVLVAPANNVPEIEKICAFIVPPGYGINYRAAVWHFPLIVLEESDFLVVDRKGSDENLEVHFFKGNTVTLEYKS